MGYYDRALMHADKRNKGMNSTTNEKGADGKKNNSSEYNHQYYMKNKEKWKNNKATTKEASDLTGMDEESIDELRNLANEKGTDSKEYKELLDILAEGDAEQAKKLEAILKKDASSEEEFDVDAAARDVMAGKYKNGAERKAALGDDYEAVQKRVNELSKNKVKHFDYDQNELYHHGILGQKWGVRRFENKNGTLTAAGKARYDDGKVSAKEKNAFSAKAAGHRLMAKVYGANEKAYAKSNKTLSSMNAHAKNEQLKKAEAAQKAANDKRDAKVKRTLESEGNSKFNSDTVKKVAKVGAVAAGTALAVYGAYKVNQLNNKATEGIRREATSAAKHLEKMANFNSQNAFIQTKSAAKMLDSGNAAEHKRLTDGANRSSEAAMKMFMDAADAARKANQAHYSVKEKVDWLKKNR